MTEASSIRILNVNDDEANRYLVSRILRRAGFQVEEADCGEEALRSAFDRPPDLVILDVKLPDIGGFEVCRRLKTDPRTSQVVVLHTSATFVTSEKKVQGLDGGADGYLTQPMEPPELIATVRALLRARAAEEASRKAAHQWQATFDALSDGVCLLDREGRIRRGNRAMGELVGVAPAQLEGASYEEILRRALGVQGVLPSHEAMGERRRAEAEVRGGERWLRLSANPILDGEGAVEGAVALVADITDRKYLAAELRQRAELLADNDRRKDEFLAMLSHELRNPLSAITTSLYLQDRTGAQDERNVKLRAMVGRQVRHLTRLVDDLLDVSRITRGKIQLQKERFDLTTVVRHALQTARPLLDARRHQFTLELPDEPLPVHADPTRLEQVVVNLLSNAAKYTPEGGHVRLQLVERTTERGPVGELRVRDSGIGIPPQMLGRVFDLFVQVDQSLARSQGGLGIGLTLVQNLVRMHGGTVEAHSEGEGKGTEFVVLLPLAREEQPRVSPQAEELRRALDVVVVVDDPALQHRVRPRGESGA